MIDTTLGYLEFVLAAARRGRDAGLSPLETARETDLGEYAGWLDSERIVGNLHRAYADLAPDQGIRACSARSCDRLDRGGSSRAAARGTELRTGDIIGSGTVGTGCILEHSRSHGSDAYAWLQPGDVVEMTIDRLGTIKATITDDH